MDRVGIERVRLIESLSVPATSAAAGPGELRVEYPGDLVPDILEVEPRGLVGGS